MSKLLDVVYAAALAYGGYRGMLTKWSGGVSALLVLVAPGKLKSLISLVLTAALSRKWGVLGSSHHTVVPAVVTAVMTFVYAFHKKSLKSTKMAVMKEDPSVSYESKLVESDVKGWGYRSVKFVQEDANTIKLVGDPHYPDLNNKLIPNFISFILEMTGITREQFDMKAKGDATIECWEDTRCTPLKEDAKAALALAVGDSKVEYELHSRKERSRGGYFAYVIPTNKRYVDAVVYPESVDDVKALIKVAEEYALALIPRGGGTNVSNMLEVPMEEKRPVLSVDMTRMHKLLNVDEVNLTCELQAGANGRQVEEMLNARGFTMGHEPDSYEFSTVGGWVSTNASGMKRTRYGNIEDIVLDVKMITASGMHSKKIAVARYSHGPDVQQMLYGSEGNFGVITSVVAKVHRLAEQQDYDSFVFHSWEQGVAFLRESFLAGCTPAACRLVDNDQFRFGHALKPVKTKTKEIVKSKIQTFAVTKVMGFDPKKMCATTMKFEGSAFQVAKEKEMINVIAKKHGGISGGAEGGRTGYNVTMAIAYIGDFLAQHNVIGETFETCCAWDKITLVIDAAKKEVKKQHDAHGLPGNGFISSRVTQQYHSGVCIYFTYGYWHGGMDGAAAKFEEIYFALKKQVVDAGGAVSHHHGVGKLRKPFIEDGTLWDDTAKKAVRAFKDSIDPQNIFAAANNFCGESTPH